MKFHDLLNMPYDRAGNILMTSLMRELPNTPNAVLLEIYSLHGRKPGFQDQYADIAIDKIHWLQQNVSAAEIIGSSVYDGFARWFQSVANRVEDFPQRGWKCVDVRSSVCDCWRDTGTWLEPPFLVSGEVVGSRTKFHLVEGHTRVGLLKGLVEHGYVSPESGHQIWVGAMGTA